MNKNWKNQISLLNYLCPIYSSTFYCDIFRSFISNAFPPVAIFMGFQWSSEPHAELFLRISKSAIKDIIFQKAAAVSSSTIMCSLFKCQLHSVLENKKSGFHRKFTSIFAYLVVLYVSMHFLKVPKLLLSQWQYWPGVWTFYLELHHIPNDTTRLPPSLHLKSNT